MPRSLLSSRCAPFSGSDVRSALDRLELVDSALATLRRREIERWSSEPAEYVVALLGPRPSRSRPRATVAAGHRRDRGLATLGWRQRWLRLAERLDTCARPAERGLGGPKAPSASSRTLRRCDATLGLEETDRARAVNGGPLLDPATAAVLARGRSGESPSLPRPRGVAQLGRGKVRLTGFPVS